MSHAPQKLQYGASESEVSAKINEICDYLRQIRIVADLSDIASVGTYPVPVKVYVDAEGVGVVGEYSIVVNVSK